MLCRRRNDLTLQSIANADKYAAEKLTGKRRGAATGWCYKQTISYICTLERSRQNV